MKCNDFRDKGCFHEDLFLGTHFVMNTFWGTAGIKELNIIDEQQEYMDIFLLCHFCQTFSS
jgi:hypothetical protein